MRKFLIYFLFISNSLLFSAEPEIAISLNPSPLPVNQQGLIAVSSSEKADKIIPPVSVSLDFSYAGSSHNFQMSTINGKSTSIDTFIYNFLVTPKKKGTFPINPFEVVINGKSFLTKPLSIKVVKEASDTSAASEPDDPFSQFENFFKQKEQIPVLGFRLSAKPAVVLRNQQLVLEGYLFSDKPEAMDYQYVEAASVRSDKCSLQDISSTVNGKITHNGGFYQKIIKRYIVFPIEDGKLGIAPPVIIAITPYGKIQLKSDTIGIDSLPVKKGNGIAYVGDLFITAVLSTNKVITGHSTDFTLEMKGSGNLKSLANIYSQIAINGLILSAPVVDNKMTGFQNSRATFQQTVRYTITPNQSGKFTIPSMTINYFDNQGLPKIITLNSQTFEALPIGNTVLFNKAPDLKPLGNIKDFYYLFFHPFFLITLLIMLTMPLAAYFFGKHQERLKKDNAYSRKFNSSTKLSNNMSLAKKMLEKKKYKEFYLAIQKGVFYYIADYFNLPSGMSYHQIQKELSAKKADSQIIDLFNGIYSDCSRNAYSNHISENESSDILERAQKLIRRIGN